MTERKFPFPPFVKNQYNFPKSKKLDKEIRTAPIRFVDPIKHISKIYKIKPKNITEIDIEDLRFEDIAYTMNMHLEFQLFLKKSCIFCSKFNQSNYPIEDFFSCDNNPRDAEQRIFWIKELDKLIFYWNNGIMSKIKELEKGKFTFGENRKVKKLYSDKYFEEI